MAVREVTLAGVGKRPMTLQEVYDGLETLKRQGVELARCKYAVRTSGMMNPVISRIEVEVGDGEEGSGRTI